MQKTQAPEGRLGQ